MSTPNVSVGDLALDNRGAFKIGPFGSSLKKSELVKAGISVVGIENILPNEFITGFRRFITPQKFQDLSDYEIVPNDILVTTMGTIGRSAVAPPTIGKAIFDSHLFRMRINTKRVYPAYLSYALNSNHVASQLSKMARGAIMEGLNTTILRECTIPLPSIANQIQIATTLHKVQRLKNAHRYGLEMCDEFLPAVFIEMFGDPLQAASELLARFTDVLEIQPQNGLYAPSERYTSIDDSRGTEMVHMSDLFGGIVVPGRLRRVLLDEKEIKKYQLDEDDLLIARRSINYEGAAQPCRIPPTQEPIAFKSSIIRVRPDVKRVLPIYLYYYLMNDAVREMRVRRYVTISTISGINQDGLSRIDVVVPPIALQRQFAAVVKKHEKLRVIQVEALRQADHLFQTLLHQAFSDRE